MMKVKNNGDYFPNILIKLLINKFKDKLIFKIFAITYDMFQKQLN